MRVSGSRHLCGLLVVSLGILYYYRIEKVVLTTLGLLRRDLFKGCYSKNERNKFMKLVEYFLFRFGVLKAFEIEQSYNYVKSFSTNDIFLWIRCSDDTNGEYQWI